MRLHPRRLIWRVLLGAALVGSACDRRSYPLVECHDVRDCFFADGYGLCLDIGDGRRYCAYKSIVCPTGYAWDITAPTDFVNVCVTPDRMPMDGGTDGAARDAGVTDGG